MASGIEIQKAMKLLLGAGLDYAPAPAEIEQRLEAWLELLVDVPGDLLIRAAKDIAVSGDKFPSVPRLREQANRYANRWYENQDPTAILHGAYRWTVQGIERWTSRGGARVDWSAVAEESAQIDQAYPLTEKTYASWVEAAEVQRLERIRAGMAHPWDIEIAQPA